MVSGMPWECLGNALDAPTVLSPFRSCCHLGVPNRNQSILLGRQAELRTAKRSSVCRVAPAPVDVP